jgi:signal transduction histidine kinase
MTLMRHASIRRDLVIIIMTITVLSIVLTTLSMAVIGYFNLKSNIEDDLQRAAAIVGDRNAALLEYAHIPSIRRRAFINLNVFSDDNSIVMTCLYNSSRQLVAFYDRSAAELNDMAASSDIGDDEFTIRIGKHLPQYQEKCPPVERIEAGELDSSVEVARVVAVKGKLRDLFAEGNDNSVGYIYIKTDLEKIDNYVTGQVFAAFFITVGILGICYLLTLKLQNSISLPILRLSEATRKVSLYKDYSVRVESRSGQYSDEIAQLIESFNGMLTEIEDRDSKLMRKNLELERAKEIAESASIAKTQFLANVSHELRTPLNAIIGFSAIIVNQLFGPLGNAKYTDYGRDIHDSGVHLLDIINDILDLSKAEAGKLKLKLERFDVTTAINKCVGILAERAREGEVHIHTNLQSHMPEIVADRVRFIQIMLNLMSNAVKFTDPGGRVDVTIEAEQARGDIAYFSIKVTDTGIGMRKDDIDRAFQTFGQLDSGLNRKYEGTGLGLPLTKKLVELHNASIRIESELRKGTTVSVRFISDPSLLD